MLSKILIRSIPTTIFRVLESMAVRHDRSTEAEARQAIQSWVEPSILETERNTRKKEVSQRLVRLLEQVNLTTRGQPIRPSHVAQKIGEERAEEIEDFFLGQKEPTFNQLSAIADLFGIEEKWLHHGDGHIFPVKTERLAQDPETALLWLTTWQQAENQTADTVKKLYLVRAANPQGSFYIVKKSSRGHFQIFGTGIHLSEQIGAGGEAMLRYLFVTLELLYKRHTKGGPEFTVTGNLLRQEDVDRLIHGQTNPGALLQDNGSSTWWEDIWDKGQVDKQDYWTGWNSLCTRIESLIISDKHLAEIREKIRSGDLR